MNNIKSKKKLEIIILNELRAEFEPGAYQLECETNLLNIPDNYGKIPTLEDLKINTNLCKVTYFDYKILNAINDTNKYEEKFKSYIKNKYNSNSNIYFSLENTGVCVFLEY